MAQFAFTTPTNVKAYTTRWQEALSRAQTILVCIPASTPETTLEKFESYERLADAQGSDSSLIRNVHPDPAMRAEAEKAEQEWKKLNTSLSLDPGAYAALLKVPLDNLDVKEQRSVKNMLRDYRREGVDKDDEFREKIKVLKEELAIVKQQFDKNINEDTRFIMVSPSDLDGLPQDYLESHRPEEEGGLIKITTNYPDVSPVMLYAHSEETRKKLSIARRTAGYPQNTPVLIDMFKKRKELAEMLGYKSYADYRLDPEMVKNGDNARDFIEKINGLAKGRKEADLKEMGEVKPGGGKVWSWDGSYLGGILEKTKYAFDAQAARQYFPFNTVKHGILASMEKLFNIKFQAVETETWHPDVETYHLLEDGKVSGRFFLDLHPQENKYKHAAQFGLRNGIIDEQMPEAALVCNFPKGEELMEHGDVVTFFHEFGHLLHTMFAKQKKVGMSGISCQWDFVEAPSQMLEQWAYDKETLKSFAKNANGEIIPDEVVDGLLRARVQGRGMGVCGQMAFAFISLALHDGREIKTEEDIDAVAREASEKYSAFPHIPETHMAHSFGHLGGYTAAYYCYMWSRVIAEDLFSRFKQAGLYDRAVADEYKEKVLSQGGSQDAADMVKAFLGREYSFDAFGEYLEEY